MSFFITINNALKSHLPKTVKGWPLCLPSPSHEVLPEPSLSGHEKEKDRCRPLSAKVLRQVHLCPRPLVSVAVDLLKSCRPAWDATHAYQSFRNLFAPIVKYWP